MHRFTDIESTPKRLTPVYGYLTHQLVPLQKALEPISSQIDQLDRFSKIAKNECHFPSEHGLTRDESAAIFLYTMEWGESSLYQVINRTLRAEDRSTLKPWFGYLKLFDAAVQKLPTVQKNIWRGAARNIAQNYKAGDEFTWWTISSCSTTVNIIKDFLGSNSTLFLIEAVNGKDISKYTNYPSENEVILCPGTRLRVVSDPLDQPPMHVVHLQEVTDETEDQLTTTFHAMEVTSPSKTESISKAKTVQSSQIQIVTDQWGNRYETAIHILYRRSCYCICRWLSNTQLQNNDEGELREGKKHGKGKMDYADGNKYIGDWANDVRTGQGVFIWSDGSHYEGQSKDNNMHGKGTFVWGPDSQWAGLKYIGDYIDNKRTGQGVYIWPNGNRYEGQFKDNNRHGKGTFIWAPDAKGTYDKYTGDWVDDIRADQGVHVFANGDRYEGQFKDGKQHGRGKLTYANGKIQEGMWSNGTFVD
ncbi:unnamed protein product [Rotaria sp. Silwood1]|nr:unnamed protein product [Rotaria sp. Silwood1]CAF4927710.1 unnamed protein product [Rotaria sp. Silwood1]